MELYFPLPELCIEEKVVVLGKREWTMEVYFPSPRAVY